MNDLREVNYILNQRISAEWIYASEEWKKIDMLTEIQSKLGSEVWKMTEQEIEKRLKAGESLKDIFPECFFKPQYPYNFKIDLILNGENFGSLEIVVKDGLNIAEIKGDKKTLAKLEEISKKNEGIFFNLPEPMGRRVIPYPLKKVNELRAVLRNEKITKNRDYEAMSKFIANTYSPINVDLLYEKTGIEILY